MRAAIFQSCYIPWKGFFDLIGRCDRYVIFDSVPYVSRHWHNRTRINMPNGPICLTIPVKSNGSSEQPIDQIEIAEPWAEKHFQMIAMAYRRASYWRSEFPLVRTLYEQAEKERLLTNVNELFLRGICQRLGLSVRIERDTSFEWRGPESDALIHISRELGATRYLAGPSARAYLDVGAFARHGIVVEWMNYSGYLPYDLPPGASEFVTIFDVLFRTGPATLKHVSGHDPHRAADAASFF